MCDSFPQIRSASPFSASEMAMVMTIRLPTDEFWMGLIRTRSTSAPMIVEMRTESTKARGIGSPFDGQRDHGQGADHKELALGKADKQ